MKYNQNKNNMLIRQSKNTFIRFYGDYGYITNQLTKRDLVLNESGKDFLKEISREPKNYDEIINNLLKLYKGVTKEEIENDFLELASLLTKQGFTVTGETVEELNDKDISFSYQLSNPKTSLYDYSFNEKHQVLHDSYDYLNKVFQKDPCVLGLQIGVSSRCNERCVHCYIPNENKQRGIDIDTNLVYKLLDEAKEMGTLQVTFSGGELFLHKEINNILRYARKNDFVISILSNLTLLNDSHIETLKEVNPTLVQVSLYSMKEEEHDAITLLKGSFKKTKHAIEKLVESNIPIQISCPVMKLNRNSYKDVLQYANSLSVKAYTDFIMMAKSDLSVDNLDHRLNMVETEELLTDILIHDTEYINNIINQEPKSKDIEKYKREPICGVAIDNICVSANGDYYPCAGWQDMFLGNAKKESLRDVWENSETLKMLRKITHSSFPTCVECEAKDYCSMCLVRNYNENQGDMYMISRHFCDVAFLNKSMVEDFREKFKAKVD